MRGRLDELGQGRRRPRLRRRDPLRRPAHAPLAGRDFALFSRGGMRPGNSFRLGDCDVNGRARRRARGRAENRRRRVRQHAAQFTVRRRRRARPRRPWPRRRFRETRGKDAPPGHPRGRRLRGRPRHGLAPPGAVVSFALESQALTAHRRRAFRSRHLSAVHPRVRRHRLLGPRPARPPLARAVRRSLGHAEAGREDGLRLALRNKRNAPAPRPGGAHARRPRGDARPGGRRRRRRQSGKSGHAQHRRRRECATAQGRRRRAALCPEPGPVRPLVRGRGRRPDGAQPAQGPSAIFSGGRRAEHRLAARRLAPRRLGRLLKLGPPPPPGAAHRTPQPPSAHRARARRPSLQDESAAATMTCNRIALIASGKWRGPSEERRGQEIFGFGICAASFASSASAKAAQPRSRKRLARRLRAAVTSSSCAVFPFFESSHVASVLSARPGRPCIASSCARRRASPKPPALARSTQASNSTTESAKAGRTETSPAGAKALASFASAAQRMASSKAALSPSCVFASSVFVALGSKRRSSSCTRLAQCSAILFSSSAERSLPAAARTSSASAAPSNAHDVSFLLRFLNAAEAFPATKESAARRTATSLSGRCSERWSASAECAGTSTSKVFKISSCLSNVASARV
mmetsp:Transcript_25624/g.86101  ORF Transcript_25624/g.86101 Transcript_25624/m.86101 type:complete len:635 (-) Transcript_25624:2835-4739(-)